MAMKSIDAENVIQAYSGDSWEYSSVKSAYAGYANAYLLCATILRFDIPAFVGLSEALEASIICAIGVGAEVTLRWALCTSDANKANYLNTKATVTDSYQIASGTAAFSGMSSTVVTRTIKCPTTKIKGGNTYYLFLWAYNETGISIQPATSGYGDHAVSLGYNIGALRVKTSDGVKLHAVYVKTASGVQQMIPYVMTASGPKPGG